MSLESKKADIIHELFLKINMQNRRQRSRNSYSRSTPQASPRGFRFKPFLIVIAIVLIGAYLFSRGQDSGVTSTNEANVAGVKTTVRKTEQTPFPTLDTSSFTSTQQKMLSVMKAEYAKQPTSYDDTVLKYTEGFKESWCADFISWVRVQADKPFINPETGYWRIPGVQSLRDYYASSDAYHLVGTYTPKFGDVAFYFGETPDGTNREHVAFVLAVQGDTLITLGGNETSKGVLQLRSNKLSEGERGLSGFGQSSP